LAREVPADLAVQTLPGERDAALIGRGTRQPPDMRLAVVAGAMEVELNRVLRADRPERPWHSSTISSRRERLSWLQPV
jgi:hypothetical protein